ncbi:MAG: hypothetical protein ABIM89_01215 [Mycobacteriales bacterium]
MTMARRYTLVAAAVLILIWMVAFQWEWSFIDDVGHKTSVNGALREDGISGLFSAIGDSATYDRSWGLFRPMYYVYSVFFYLVNPAVAHGIRLAMMLAAVLIPALRFGRDRLAALMGVAVLAANITLYQGLSYLSLQELSGVALIAVGFLWDGPVRRSLWWLAAAWFKTPFVWLFLAWSVYLLSRRKYWAALNIAVGIATVVLAVKASRSGTYTQGLSFANVSVAIKSALPLIRWPGLVGILAIVALRPDPRTIAWRDPLAWVFLVGGALYLGNLLPWGQAGSYYGAPAIWLLSVGVLRMVLMEDRAEFRLATYVTTAAAVLTLGAAGYISLKMTREQIDRNAAVVGVRDWARNIPPDETIAINSEEAAVRLAQLLTLRGTPHPVVFVPDGDATAQPRYYVFFHDQSGGSPRLQQNPVRSFEKATVYAPPATAAP